MRLQNLVVKDPNPGVIDYKDKHVIKDFGTEEAEANVGGLSPEEYKKVVDSSLKGLDPGVVKKYKEDNDGYMGDTSPYHLTHDDMEHAGLKTGNDNFSEDAFISKYENDPEGFAKKLQSWSNLLDAAQLKVGHPLPSYSLLKQKISTMQLAYNNKYRWDSKKGAYSNQIQLKSFEDYGDETNDDKDFKPEEGEANVGGLSPEEYKKVVDSSLKGLDPGVVKKYKEDNDGYMGDTSPYHLTHDDMEHAGLKTGNDNFSEDAFISKYENDPEGFAKKLQSWSNLLDAAQLKVGHPLPSYSLLKQKISTMQLAYNNKYRWDSKKGVYSNQIQLKSFEDYGDETNN